MNKPVTVLNPYRDKAFDYREKFWLGVIPLPYKEKNPPPTDFTGHRAPYPAVDQIKAWCEDGKQHNIGVRLAGVDTEYEIIGIDVDHYLKGDKKKVGGEQLQVLEQKLGPLPDTWISSARQDGISGIRYFLVPRGLAFRGQIDKDIECISKGYRFAVTWPSVHPDGGTYWWFPPGTKLDKDGRQAWDGVIPNARELPLLPESWLNFLTQGRMRSELTDLIDMDSSVDDIYTWADNTFYGDDETDLCEKMQEKLDRHKHLIEDEATSHDKLINAHYNIIRLAAEGHRGWNKAVNELEAHFKETTLDRGKRGLTEVIEEIFRSRINALRKIKAQIDQRVAIGAAAVDPACEKTGACGGGDRQDLGGFDDGGDFKDVPGPCGLKAVPDYDRNDDGNALHLIHMFSSNLGPSFKWVEGYGWIVWKNTENPHWEVDQDGTNIVRRMWHRVKKRQKDYADACKAVYEVELQNAIKGGQPTSGMNAPVALTVARNEYKIWSEWAEKSGNNRQANAAVEAAKSLFESMRVDVNDLDSNHLLLGVANGVLDLGFSDGVNLRKAVPSDLITMNTNTPYERPNDFAKLKWNEYLQTFIPDEELRRVVQILLGHCIIGGNRHKLLIALKGDPNTGKSTMINAIEGAMGQYVQTVDQGMLKSRQFNSTLANALNKRFAVCSEFDDTDPLSAAVIKRITGGTDEITTEIKFSMAQKTGVPQFQLILASNGVPKISGADKALKNRLKTIPFNVALDYPDPTAADVVKTICKTAVLEWLVEGYIEYRRLGQRLPSHPAIDQATEEFMSEFDDVATFAYEMLQKTSKGTHFIKISDMYTRYTTWCNQNNIQIKDRIDSNRFGRRLRALGWKSGQSTYRGENGKFWFDVKFRKLDSVVVQMPQLGGANPAVTKTGEDSVTE